MNQNKERQKDAGFNYKKSCGLMEEREKMVVLTARYKYMNQIFQNILTRFGLCQVVVFREGM